MRACRARAIHSDPLSLFDTMKIETPLAESLTQPRVFLNERYQPQQKMRIRAMIMIQMQLLSNRLQRQLFIVKSSS